MLRIDNIDYYYSIAISLLKEMIEIPSYSKEEEHRANFLYNFLYKHELKSNYTIERIKNNIIVYNNYFSNNRQTLMLTAHIDTVHESPNYSFNPFKVWENDGNIYGLGTNDDGASVVSQIACFLYFSNLENNKDCSVNLLLTLSAEEEISGKNGIDLIMKEIKTKNSKNISIPLFPNFVIIGEPTGMNAAIGERGLLVIDAQAEGISAHVATEDGINALYVALDDINTIRNIDFGKVSPLMGKIRANVTQINSGQAHNVVPSKANFTIDIRTTECYTNLELFNILKGKLKSKLSARNLDNKCSYTPTECALSTTIKKLGIKEFISPTTSDWMRLDIAAIKMGPGNSSRSHKADEFININEIKQAIGLYINFIKNIK